MEPTLLLRLEFALDVICFLFKYGFYCCFFFFYSVKTDMLPGRALSRLYIANANRHDTGNYTCMLGNDITGTVIVHVLNGLYTYANILQLTYIYFSN